jgi:hypothetical protein
MAVFSDVRIWVPEPGFQMDLDELASAVHERLRGFVRETRLGIDFETQVLIEEGSFSARARALAAAAAIYAGIANYGDFRQGLEIALNDAKRVNAWVVEDVLGRTAGDQKDVRISGGTGLAGDLERLFRLVEEGRMTPEEATKLAINQVLREPGAAPPAEAENRLYEEFRKWHRFRSVGVEGTETSEAPPLQSPDATRAVLVVGDDRRRARYRLVGGKWQRADQRIRERE